MRGLENSACLKAVHLRVVLNFDVRVCHYSQYLSFLELRTFLGLLEHILQVLGCLVDLVDPLADLDFLGFVQIANNLEDFVDTLHFFYNRDRLE